MVASLDKVENAEVQKNDTVEKYFMSNKTLTDYITSLQAHNLKLINLVKNLTACPTALETRANPNKGEKPPWDPTGYCWSRV